MMIPRETDLITESFFLEVSWGIPKAIEAAILVYDQVSAASFIKRGQIPYCSSSNQIRPESRTSL